MKMNTMTKRMLSILLCMVMLLSYLPTTTWSVDAAEQFMALREGSKVADADTLDGWEDFFGPDVLNTEFAGDIWTDKSVLADVSDKLPGVTLDDSNNFLVALSAIASNLAITGHTSAPTDTVLVLDMSGSMVDDTYEVGTVRQGYDYVTANGIDMSLINAMVEATNATIHKLMNQNVNNRVGVVLYSGNAATNQTAKPADATVVLPLGRYNGVDGEYLSVDAAETTQTLYTYRNYRWRESGQATYVAEGSAVNVSVRNGLKTEAGADVADTSKRANGGTYTQNGMLKAMEQFLAVQDTTVPAGRAQAGAERMPVLVLMTDGAPTIATTNYINAHNVESNTGDGTTTTNTITFLTQLTAAYVRGRVAEKYCESAADEEEMLFFTLGLGTENSSAATDTLYPAGSNATLVGYWNTYLAGTSGRNVKISNDLTVRRDGAVAAMNYVDTYYYADDAQGLIDSFVEIVSEIELKASSYATLVEGGNADLSGYITFEDELGELMQVTDMKGVLMNDGNGGTVLYTGKGIAESMTAGLLGSVDDPTARGDELVRTVRERIPGTTTSQAQQLIANAYNDQQLFYTDSNNWSNYIGWYADADGNYAGFWDKDSGYTGAPAGAVYANRSYGYLGVNGESDMMHVVVLVRTELATLHQTVMFKIPASLLPAVQYRVTLDEDDPDTVETFERVDAVPMRLVFEVGLREDINAVNLNAKIEENLQKGGHVHRNEDGSVTFYTNEWAIGNDKNGNGIPDREEVATAMVAKSHFQPAMDNAQYFYTEDTLVLDANGDPVKGSARPTVGYHPAYHYDQAKRYETLVPVAASTLAGKAVYDAESDQWYIPAGVIFADVSALRRDKEENKTETLAYASYPATFETGEKQDYTTFLGNNGAFTLAPATGFTLRKEVQGTIADASEYSFEVTLSDLPAGTAAAPLLTDANGDAISGVTLSEMEDDRFTLTLPANVTAYISGIPVGTTVSIAEQINGDYKIVKILVAGREENEASFTVPAYTEEGDQMVPVIVTNAPNAYGDLVISKEVVHELATVPAALADKVFTFRVRLAGDRITEGSTFQTAEGIAVKVDADGYVTYADGTPITLKNEESITICGIPEDTAYTVTEDSLPGFKLSSVNGNTALTEASGTILPDTANMAEFVNRYPDDFTSVEVPLDIKVNKVLESTQYNGDEEFVFVLQMLLPDNTYPAIEDDHGNAYLKVAANTSGSTRYTLSFDQLGTYFFRVVELKPSEQAPAGTDTNGMSYSTQRSLFRVIVTDDNMDGTLEVKLEEEAHIDNEIGNGYEIETTFVNEYQVNATNTSLNVHKELKDPAGANYPLTAFTFTLYPSDAEGVVAAGTAGVTVTSSALGDATFNIFLNTEGWHYYKVVENIPATAVKVDDSYFLNGMTYDPTEFLFSVRTEANAASELVVVERTLQNLTTGATVDPKNGVYTATFQNVYELTSVDVTVPFSKELTGRAPQAGEEYTVRLEQTDAAFVALEGVAVKNYSIAPGESDTATLTFDKVGVYHYKWTEVVPNGAVKDSGSGLYVYSGVYYDNAEYRLTVTVTDNGDGTLASATAMRKLGETALTGEALFVNRYLVHGEEAVTFGGEKVLNGRKPIAGEFTFGLYRDADCIDEIERVTNRADGTFSFSPITYTVEDLGENHAPKTDTYYVKELKGSQGGMSWDETLHTVTVTVSHENGELVVTPSGNALTLEFENTYEAKPTEVILNGQKVLVGDWTAVADANKTFKFQLFAANEQFAILDHTSPLQEKTVVADGTYSMTLSYMDGQEGFYYYVLKEYIPTDRAGGVSYDAGEYHITVNVTDPGDGQLTAMTTIYRPGTGNTNLNLFTNRYTVEPTDIVLVGDKNYTNSVTGEEMPMDEGMFSFVVLEGEKPVATGYNLADGTIRFTPIHYTAKGTHEYTVRETEGEAGGVWYDDAVFEVTVTVTDNGDGTLTAAADYQGTPIVFNNTYTHGAAEVTFNGTKALAGDWSAVNGENKQFEFALFEADAQWRVDPDSVKYAYGSEGAFSFGTKTYTTEGIHYYVLRESEYGQKVDGISYDDAEYHITVTVEDDGNGNLIPTVTALESGVTVTVDAQNSRLVTVEGLTFTNRYEASPAPYTPVAQKEYLGDDMKAFDFILEGDSITTQKKQNDTVTGEVTFDTVYFDAAGEYELTVREQANVLWGLIRWDRNVYTIKLTVEDNGEGSLFVDDSLTEITSVKGSEDILFRNVHHSVITDKDVFKANDLTVSIDGEEVEVGDILTYVITYHNYDSVPVDIAVTDTVPAYTNFVSADNGGVYTDGVITWSVEAVAPDTDAVVSFKVRVVGENAVIPNSATVLEGENEYQTNEVRNHTVDPVKDVFAAGDLTVSIDGEEVEQGDQLTYAITYWNTNAEAVDVEIRDAIPEYTTFVSVQDGGEHTDGQILWNKTVAAGESVTVHFTVQVAVDEAVLIPNTATVISGGNTYETNEVKNYTAIPEKDVFKASDLTVSIDGEEVKNGDQLTYAITYENKSEAPVDVEILDAIPEHTTFVSVQDGGEYTDGEIVWNKTVAASGSVTVHFTVQVAVDEAVLIPNTATVISGDNTYETNEVRNYTVVPEKDVFKAEDLTVSIDGEVVKQGDRLTYTITYENKADVAVDVEIIDTVPTYTSFVSADEGGEHTDGQILWNKTVAAGDSVTVSFTVTVDAADAVVIPNTAMVISSGNTYETNEVRNHTVVPVKDVFDVSDLTVSIDGEKVYAGDTLVYAIDYKNTDTEKVTLTITDQIPEYTTYVDGSADNGGEYADGKITWTVDVEAGETVTVTFKVKVADAGNVTIANQAEVREGENTYTTNEVTNYTVKDEVVKDVFDVSDLTVSIDGKKVYAGDTLVYAIDYKNTDTEKVTVTITDAIPEYTTYVDGSADNGGEYADGKITWTVDVEAGATATVTFRVKVDDVGAVTIPNKAQVVEGKNTYTTNEVINYTVEDPVGKKVFNAEAPTVDIDGKKVDAGNTLVYAITYKNTASEKVTVTVTDTVPTHTTYVNGSADNRGVHRNGVITWTLEVEAGAEVTVTFKVKVNKVTSATIKNKATVLEGKNTYTTNEVSNPTSNPPIPSIPKTDDTVDLQLWFTILFLSCSALITTVLCGRKREEAEA